MVVDLLIDRIKSFLRRTWNRKLWLRFQIDRKLFNREFYRFRCNICGNVSSSPLSVVKDRELPSCYFCGSNRRFRSIVAVLSNELVGKIISLPDFKESKHIIGIGLSDSGIYSKALSRIFSYKNTYYHKEPRLDITSIRKEMLDKADFVISSDVFEHVSPPIDRAFDNLFKILKKGGVCIFSVPYKNEGITEEYFLEIFEYTIKRKKGKKVLINKTRQGNEQVFENLRFHGGPGAALEMREFSKSSLLYNIEKAGFINIKLHDNSIPEFGVLIEEVAPSLIISMHKP